MVEASISVSFDKTDHFKWTSGNFESLLEIVEHQKLSALTKINCLFASISDLEVDPMELLAKLTVRDLLLRIEPLLS